MVIAAGQRLCSQRLILRPLAVSDGDDVARLCADPQVMEFFPRRLSRAESDTLLGRLMDAHADHGFGMWAVEQRDVPGFCGFVGLAPATFDAPFTPCVEIGWRLLPAFWGQGIALEASREALRFAWDSLELPVVYAWTSRPNGPSQRLMVRLGMQRRTDLDFEHPRIAEGSPLRPHLVYEATSPQP